jgi:broad specificity phosphatase PhoE
MFAGLADPACRIIASPLGRAQHTARLIREHAGLRCEIVADPRLAEISLGKWDGMLRADIEQALPDYDAGRKRWSWFLDAPDGERFETISARLRDWLNEAVRLDGYTIAVSHGVSGRILRGLFLGLSQDEMLKQEIPQDACFRLFEGRIEKIAAP